jgi:hypothetical protein
MFNFLQLLQSSLLHRLENEYYEDALLIVETNSIEDKSGEI